MDHPLYDNTENLSDAELDKQISSLVKKYFQTRNPEAKRQINIILDQLKLEQRDRMIKKSVNNPNKDLDNLINID